MSKKDYIMIAQGFKKIKPVQSNNHESGVIGAKPLLWASAMAQWRTSVIMLASVLEGDNPRFDRERFLDACGYLD